MGLNSFHVENEKALRNAACDAVPPVMVVAGPNGVGKSTLLYALHRRIGVEMDPDTRIIYQPPHRAIRRQQVQRRYLTGALRTLADTFGGESVGGFEGLQIPFPQRAPDNVDEAGSVLKYTLGRLENRRQTVLAGLVDRQSQRGEPLETSGLPHVFEPIRRLTSRLLPHLAFERIDFANEDNIGCVFTRTDDVQTAELDLDDLSSGEKAIFILFLPLIESDITAHLDSLGRETATGETSTQPDRVFLIDETEQHLHPELQARLLGFMREEAARTNVQFLVTTHSPTLVDQAFDEELYVLGFATKDGGNQLRRIASTADRLSTLRTLTGSAFVITTGRTIVCVEGERQSAASATDIGLLQTLHPASSRFTFVAVGGKGNVIRVVSELRQELHEERLEVSVAGIIDKDRADSTVNGVVTWPVCMIENLLLNAAAIADVAGDAGRAEATEEVVQEHLHNQASAQREEEIALRVMEALGARTIRVKGTTLDEVQSSIAEAVASISKSNEEICNAIERATAAVDKALADDSYLDVFRGKQFLKGIYLRLGLSETQLSFEQFGYAVAQKLAESGAVTEIIDTVFRDLTQSMALVDQVTEEAELPDL